MTNGGIGGDNSQIPEGDGKVKKKVYGIPALISQDVEYKRKEVREQAYKILVKLQLG